MKKQDVCRWGVDDGATGLLLSRHPKGDAILKELGCDLWVVHYLPERSIKDNRALIREVDSWCVQTGRSWIANLEHSNWLAHHVDDQGRDWFNRPDGRHYFQFPQELLEELGQCQRLLGLMYDEAEHMQNCRNRTAKNVDQPYLYDPCGRTLAQGADDFTAAAAELAKLHRFHGLKLYTEHVFPVLYHPFARAGFQPVSKILKETWSPVYIACALGASLQYGQELWLTPDLWAENGTTEGPGTYPGHGVERYASALKLAYHMGADCIYTENLCYDQNKRGYGGLVQLTENDYTVTPHGEAAIRFRHDYMPAHPRPYSFREVRPRVAIIRQEDACWGQAASWLKDELFGSAEWHSTATTEAWMRLWHLLTRGTVPAFGLSWHASVQKTRPFQVFCPLDGVVVFDHHVRVACLTGVEAIFLTGMGLSPETSLAVEQRVSEGTLCVALPHLLPERVRALTGEDGTLADGQGRWVATPDFLAPHVRKHVLPFLPPGQVIRYRFGEYGVAIHPTAGDPNRLEAVVEHL